MLMAESKQIDARSREERMADEYWNACEKYGSEEAIHVCSELWGYSLYRVKQEIEKIEERKPDLKDKKGDIALSTGLSDAFLEWFMPSEFGFENLFGEQGIGKGFFKDFGKEKIVDEAGQETFKVTTSQFLRDLVDMSTLGLAPSYGDPKRSAAYGEFAKIPGVTQANIDAVDKISLFKGNTSLVNSLSSQLGISPEELREHVDFDKIVETAVNQGKVDVGGQLKDVANPLTQNMIQNKAKSTLAANQLKGMSPASQWMHNVPWAGTYASSPGGEDFRLIDFISDKTKQYKEFGPLLNALTWAPKELLKNPVTGSYMRSKIYGG